MRLAAILMLSVACAQSGDGLRLDAVDLRDVSGKPHRFDLRGKPSVLVFYSTVCPVSNEYNARLIDLSRDYTAKGVQILIVNANQNETAGQIRDHAKAADFAFPIYIDRNNLVADRLSATVTPEAFVVDASGVVRYRGPVDDARNPVRVHKQLLREALDAVLAGQAVPTPESKAFGCTIKRVRKS